MHLYYCQSYRLTGGKPAYFALDNRALGAPDCAADWFSVDLSRLRGRTPIRNLEALDMRCAGKALAASSGSIRHHGTDFMKTLLGIAAILVFLLSGWAAAQDKSAVVILAEPGFPAADSAVASPRAAGRLGARRATGIGGAASPIADLASYGASGPALRLCVS